MHTQNLATYIAQNSFNTLIFVVPQQKKTVIMITSQMLILYQPLWLTIKLMAKVTTTMK